MKLSDLTSHLTGRKFTAFAVTCFLILVAGYVIPASSTAAVITGLVASLTAFIGGHAATDVMASKGQRNGA